MVAHTDHQQARTLLAHGRPEDRARAQDLLARAAATASALGMTRLSGEVAELAAGAREPTVTK
jgi:hypothetical protein